MVQRRPQLIISITFMTGNFDYAFKLRIDQNRPQYHISTEVDCNSTWRPKVHQQRRMPSG